LAERCHGICQTAGAKLILNCAPSLATSLPCDGLHLTQRRLNDLHARPAQKQLLIGASCHDAESLEQAANLELDYALLSPVFPTATHPGVEPLGWSGFEHLVEAAHLPVYALGGVHEGMLETAFQHGAQGVAGISAFWTPTSRP
jgi:8-oxo-dGTP diphosphatase